MNKEKNTKKSVVRKSKKIVQRIPNFQLNKTEARVFHFVLNKFSEEYWDYENNCLKKNKKLEIEFPISELTNKFGLNLENVYKETTKAFENLIKFAYKMETTKTIRLTTVFSSIAYDKKDNKVIKVASAYIKLNDTFIQHFIEVKEQFSRVSLEMLDKFKSSHTFRIYDLIKIKSNEKQINFDMEINEFRKFLFLQNKYKKFLDLRRKVIEPIQKDLEASDLRATIELKRQGMKVIALHFKKLGDPNQIGIEEIQVQKKQPKEKDSQKELNDKTVQELMDSL